MLNSSVPTVDTSRGDPMEVTTGASDGDGGNNASDNSNQVTSSGQNQSLGAAAAAQQPKVVQTAFIHKLYK